MTGARQGFGIREGRRQYSAGCAYNLYGDIPVKLILGFPHIGKTTIAQARDKSYLQLTIVPKSVQVVINPNSSGRCWLPAGAEAEHAIHLERVVARHADGRANIRDSAVLT